MKLWEALKEAKQGKRIRRFDHQEPMTWVELCEFFTNCCWDEVNSHFCSDEWEVFEKPIKTYSFMEILPYLNEWKKFSRKKWEPSDVYLGSFRDAIDAGMRIGLMNNSYRTLRIEDYQANDWYEVIE